MRICIVLTICLFIGGILVAQDTEKDVRLQWGIELQAYPAGIITAAKAETNVDKYYKHTLTARLGYNRTRRHDWGEHGDERGGGFGGGLGYRHYIFQPNKGLFAGVQTDLWWMNIDYRELGEDETYGTSDDFGFGKTDVLVLLPLVEVGYKFNILAETTLIYITPHLSIGREINIITNGEEVAQGSTGLLGVDFTISL